MCLTSVCGREGGSGSVCVCVCERECVSVSNQCVCGREGVGVCV